jgi:hypothetical protein
MGAGEDPAAPGAAWGQGEIVRSINRLTAAVGRVESKVEGLHSEFVPRELHNAELGHMTTRINELGRDLTDLRADQTRRVREDQQASGMSWRWGVGLALTALLAMSSLAAQFFS